MSLEARIIALVQAIGADIKAHAMSLSGKQPTLVSSTTIKTINGASILGAGDLSLATQAEVGDIAAALVAINGA